MKLWPLRIFCLLPVATLLLWLTANAQADDVCPRFPVGSTVSEPVSLSSSNGVLEVDFTYHEMVDSNGLARYCHLYNGSVESPTLRVRPGDLLILRLTNDVVLSSSVGGMPLGAIPLNSTLLTQGGGTSQGAGTHAYSRHRAMPPSSNAAMEHATDASMNDASSHPMDHSMDDLTGGLMDLPGSGDVLCNVMTMSASYTNLHFHGMNVSPLCHQDEIIHTLIKPHETFEYRVQIPANEPPGLYWYHPHPHGVAETQVLGGASGALIVEGIEQVNPEVAGLPERVLVLRDQLLPGLGNGGQGLAQPPAKDISINYVPVLYPRYQPAVLKAKAGEREFWRVSNSAADTYFDLAVLVDGVPQPLKLIEMDGVDIPAAWAVPKAHYLLQYHVLIPPASRTEFVVTMPPSGADARLVTLDYDTGPDGDYDPSRPIAQIQTSADAPDLPVHIGTPTEPLSPRRFTGLDQLAPDGQRTLYFSEQLSVPGNPNSPTVFFITEEGQVPQVFNFFRKQPNITVQLGSVEDWTIENRAEEAHAFHIHQIHFQVLERNGQSANDPELRDTIDLPYWDGQGPYPSVKLRMDFRDPDIVGTFVYHCHILGHEDGGMMGAIEVVAK